MNEGITLALYIIFLVLHFITLIVHLLFCCIENKVGRLITKPFIYLFLGLALCFYIKDYPLIISACFLASIAGIFMMFKKYTICLYSGVVIYLVEHVLLLFSITRLLSSTIPWWIYLTVYMCVLLVSVVTLFIFKNLIKFFTILSLLTQFVNIVFIFLLVGEHLYLYAVFLYVGYLFYMLSSYLQYYFISNKKIKRDDFYIMLPYIIGQTMILLTITYASLNILD